MHRTSYSRRSLGAPRLWALPIALFALCLSCDDQREPADSSAAALKGEPRTAPAPASEELKAAKANAEATGKNAKIAETAPEPAPATASRLESIQKRHAEVTSKSSLILKSHAFECSGGEVRTQLHRYFEQDQLAQATIQVAFAGHASEHYQFIYENQTLVFAVANQSSWMFTSGPPGEDTADTITQHRYYFDQGAAFRCLKKQAKGPTKQIDKLLEQAPNAESDCALSDKLKQLAGAMQSNESEPAVVKQVLCKL